MVRRRFLGKFSVDRKPRRWGLPASTQGFLRSFARSGFFEMDHARAWVLQADVRVSKVILKVVFYS